MNDKWAELINNPPTGLDRIAELFDLSADYEYPTPATLFLDLIGYSEEEIGEFLVPNLRQVARGYLELGKLGQALDEYTDRPIDADLYIRELLEAEGQD